MSGYLFVHFKGCEQTPMDEQLYFALSKDGVKWHNVNGGEPIAVSVMGEQGLRDPHILRAENGRFYMIATDLSINHRRGQADMWRACQVNGSKCIAVWESDDLINWSEQSMVQVAPDNAGCAWAPESIYDHERDEYMVFWSSKTADDDYTKQRVWRAYTKDFVTFTNPEIYIEREHSVIDTSIIYANGMYYRVTKNESEHTVFMDKCASLNGEFEYMDCFSLDKQFGFEGPTLCKVNGEEKWFLLMDNFVKKEGYKLFVTDDIDKADFKPSDGFTTPDIFRHGTILPVTDEEYGRIVEKWGTAD